MGIDRSFQITSRLLPGIATLFLVTAFFPFALSSQARTATAMELFREAETFLSEGRDRYDERALLRSVDFSQRALELNPRYAAAHRSLGEARLWLGDYALAAVHLERAQQLGYASEEIALLQAKRAVLEGNFDAAEELYLGILEKQPYNEEALIGRALIGISRGSATAADRTFRGLERRFPDNRWLLVALTEISAARGDEEALERYIQLALRYHGDNASVQLTAARIALNRNDLATAEYHGRNAVVIAPALDDAWLLLAEVARRDGRLTEALSHYESLIALDPENHRAWYARGVIAAGLDRNSVARDSWSRAVAIRPDYELPRLATEQSVMESSPLESPERELLAAPYRATGRALESRYLFRQAEQAYRRGLQINPFDRDLRRALAELYLSQGLRGRYLQELEVIQRLSSENTDNTAAEQKDLNDRIETFRAVLADSVAVRWNVDQFTASRPRTGIVIVYQPSQDTLEPDAATYLASYLENVLMGSQKIEVLERTERASLNDYRGAAEFALFLTYHLEDRLVQAVYSIVEISTARVVAADTIVRTGNDRIGTVTRELAQGVDDIIIPQGFVVDRRFDQLLVSMGRVDGITEDDTVSILSTPDAQLLGTASVTELDDLVSVLSWQPTGPDNIGIGDRVLPQLEVPEENTAAPESVPAGGRERPDSDFSRLVQRIFSGR